MSGDPEFLCTALEIQVEAFVVMNGYEMVNEKGRKKTLTVKYNFKLNARGLWLLPWSHSVMAP